MEIFSTCYSIRYFNKLSNKITIITNRTLNKKIDISMYLSIRLYIMFGPRLGCTHSISLANWHDGCGLCEGPLGLDYKYTKDIYKYLTSSCHCLVKLGQFSQDDVDCYNSLVLKWSAKILDQFSLSSFSLLSSWLCLSTEPGLGSWTTAFLDSN